MKLAINRTTVVGKPKTNEQNRRMTFTYENVDVSFEQFADLVDAGYAFCAQHKDHHRKSPNFIGSDFVAVDIDSGLTLEEAIANPLVTQCAALIYTTESHTETANRFRIVFQTNETITSAREMKDAYIGVAVKFGGDASCTDACRQFYGSSHPNTIRLGNILAKSVLEEWVRLGSESKRRTETVGGSSNAKAAIVSELTVDLDAEVTVSDGTSYRLADLPERTTIFCPKHVDNRPSAFTVRSRNGVIGIHCSACQRTYFTSRDMPLYDFNYGLKNLDQFTAKEFHHIEDDEFLTVEYGTFFRVDEKYLTELPQRTPLVLVRSPKGTGKTRWLEKIVAQLKKEKVRNDRPTRRKPKWRTTSVLLIGHRQTLIQSVARRLGLEPYFTLIETEVNGKPVERMRTNPPTDYYAVCADSLSTLLNPNIHKYDVVLIDEVEQVISHLTSNTLKERRIETFLFLKHYVDQAKKVYVLDADLNYLTVETLYSFVTDKTRLFTFVTNDYPVKDRELCLYATKKHLIGDLRQAIARGQRCFVCSNSKKQVNHLAAALKEQFDGERKILGITSENSQDAATQAFIENIQTEILAYDVVLVSPAVGTGVDITFPDNTSEIDAVFGIFEARVNTHFDIDQQLSRVRNPKEVNVWISGETFRFSIDPEVIKSEVRDRQRITSQLIEIKEDGTLVYNDHDDYLDLYANVKAMQRGSKNALRYHFRKLKEHYGWKIIDEETDSERSDEGAELAERGEELYAAAVQKNIMNARLITKAEYVKLDQLKNRFRLNSDQLYAMRRYEIESFYYQEVTPELIAKDNDGRHRSEVRTYEMFTSDDASLIVKDQKERDRDVHSTDRKDLIARKRFLHELFAVAGLSDEHHNLLTEKIIEGNTLGAFATFCRKHHEKIAQFFDMDIRKDIEKKPAQQLSQFLGLIGVTWEKEKPVKRDGKKIYRYRVPQQAVDELNAIATRRRDKTITEQWHKDREATTENRLFDEESDIRNQVEQQLSATASPPPSKRLPGSTTTTDPSHNPEEDPLLDSENTETLVSY